MFFLELCVPSVFNLGYSKLISEAPGHICKQLGSDRAVRRCNA